MSDAELEAQPPQSERRWEVVVLRSWDGTESRHLLPAPPAAEGLGGRPREGGS